MKTCLVSNTYSLSHLCAFHHVFPLPRIPTPSPPPTGLLLIFDDLAAGSDRCHLLPECSPDPLDHSILSPGAPCHLQSGLNYSCGKSILQNLGYVAYALKRVSQFLAPGLPHRMCVLDGWKKVLRGRERARPSRLLSSHLQAESRRLLCLVCAAKMPWAQNNSPI